MHILDVLAELVLLNCSSLEHLGFLRWFHAVFEVWRQEEDLGQYCFLVVECFLLDLGYALDEGVLVYLI